MNKKQKQFWNSHSFSFIFPTQFDVEFPCMQDKRVGISEIVLLFSTLLLDCHQVWRYHDPTKTSFSFLWKRCHTPLFKKDATFCRSHLFLLHLLKRSNFTARSSSFQLSARLSAQLSARLSARLSAWLSAR